MYARSVAKNGRTFSVFFSLGVPRSFCLGRKAGRMTVDEAKETHQRRIANIIWPSGL